MTISGQQFGVYMGKVDGLKDGQAIIFKKLDDLTKAMQEQCHHCQPAQLEHEKRLNRIEGLMTPLKLFGYPSALIILSALVGYMMTH
jgi:hypothetical protein